MKRVKESGASFRKKRKEKEEREQRGRSSMLKFLKSSGQSVSTIQDDQNETNTETEDIKFLTEAEDSQHTVTSEQASTLTLLNSPDRPEQPFRQGSPNSGGQTDLLEDDAQSDLILESRTDLKDVGKWPAVITDHLRMLLVQQGSAAVQHLDSEFTEVCRSGASTKGQTRKLTRDWFYRELPNGERILRSWMVYSPAKKSLFCFCCRLFSSIKIKATGSGFNTTDGFNLYWKMNPKVYEHESSNVHNDNLFKWKELEMRINQGATIDEAELTIARKEEKKWKDVLTRLLDVIRFLAKQNLALRGHRESLDENLASGNRGNFLELVMLLAKYDAILCEHVTKMKLGSKIQVSYLSPQTQNEFIQVLADQVRGKVIRQVKE